jgi:hypothetical protein
MSLRAAIAGTAFAAGLAAATAGASAQTAIDLAGIFPTMEWTVATIAGRVDVDCIATFTDSSGGPLGYEVTFANGARIGEFHFAWAGQNQIVTYSLGPRAAGSDLRSFRVAWADDGSATERIATEQLDLDAALALLAEGSIDRPLAAALEFVWADRFCRQTRMAAATP